MRSATNYIVVHCSATKPTMDIGAKEIRRWHTDPKPKGNGWNDIGYHSVIRRDGTLEEGRDYHEAGAHVKGHNHESVGVCLVGGVDEYNHPESNFTPAQFKTLKRELQWLKTLFPNAMILGHRDLNAGKACPSFDVRAWITEHNMMFLL